MLQVHPQESMLKDNAYKKKENMFILGPDFC